MDMKRLWGRIVLYYPWWNLLTCRARIWHRILGGDVYYCGARMSCSIVYLTIRVFFLCVTKARAKNVSSICGASRLALLLYDFVLISIDCRRLCSLGMGI